MPGLRRTPSDNGSNQAAALSSCPDADKPFVLAVAILGSSMAFIDGSVVGIALPAMQADLSASLSGAQWINNAYMLLLSALILAGGAAGDRFGQRRVFTAGVVLFTAASAACGLAPGEMSLIAARAVQGVGGALLVPASLALISTAFPEAERGRAIGTWAGASALTTALGPVLGGWLTDAWSWRLIFLVNVPLAAVTLALTAWRVPPDRPAENAAPVDWGGATLATLALAALAYGLTAVSDLGWRHPAIAGSLIVGLLLAGAFLWFEGRARAPMMPLGLFRSRPFSGANAITLLLYFALSGAMFFIPFNLVRLQGYSAAAAGAAFLPFTLVFGLLSRWSGALIERTGARRPLIVGPIVTGLGFALFAVPGIGGPFWSTFLAPMVVLGLGMAIAVAPLTTTVMGSVEDRLAGVASGINNAVARVAGLIAVALLGAVAVGVFGEVLEERLIALYASPEVVQAMRAEIPRLAEAQIPAGIIGAEREALERAVREAFLDAFRAVVLIAAALSFASALCAAFTIPSLARTSDARA